VKRSCTVGVVDWRMVCLVPRKDSRPTAAARPLCMQGWFGGAGGSQTNLDKWYGECHRMCWESRGGVADIAWPLPRVSTCRPGGRWDRKRLPEA
jgi:hypothetical protein